MNPKIAIKIMLGMTAVFKIFHLAIIVKIIPYNITWGGRLKSDSEMYLFKTISMVINLFFGWVLLIKGAFVKQFLPLKLVNLILWCFLGLFLLNTLGNMVAKTNFEKFFAIVTLAFSILIYIILAKAKKLPQPARIYQA